MRGEGWEECVGPAHLAPELPDGLPLMGAAPVGQDTQLWHEPAALLLPVVQGGGRGDNQKGTPDMLHLRGEGLVHRHAHWDNLTMV